MTAHERRTPRALPLGMAAGYVARSLVDADAPKTPRGYQGKTAAESKAEHQAWADEQPTTAGCAFCPDWTAAGTAAETRLAAAEHRADQHPQAGKGRKRGNLAGWARGNPSDVAEREVAMVEVEKRRQTTHAEKVAAPEVQASSPHGEASVVGNASVPGAAAAERESHASKARPARRPRVGDAAGYSVAVPLGGPPVLGEAAAVGQTADSSSARTPSGELERAATSPNTVQWTREKILAKIHAWQAEHGLPPQVSDWRGQAGYPNAITVTRRFGSWADAVEEAGYPRPRRGSTPAQLQAEAA